MAKIAFFSWTLCFFFIKYENFSKVWKKGQKRGKKWEIFGGEELKKAKKGDFWPRAENVQILAFFGVKMGKITIGII